MTQNRPTWSSALLLMPAFLAMILLASSSHAATLTVSNLNDSGAGSLRQAIIDAEANVDSDNLVNLTPNGTISLLTPLPSITKGIALWGPGADLLTIRRDDAASNFRIFDLGFGTIGSSVMDLTISNGVADFGGGIFSGSSLVVVRCVFSENTATVNGGAIDMGLSIAFASIEDSAMINNTAGSLGGGFHYVSGKSPAVGRGRIINTTVSGNSAPFGAGVAVTAFSGLDVMFDIEDCTITDNHGGDGGIRAFVSSGTVDVDVKNTIVARNEGSQFVVGGGAVLGSSGHNLVENNQGVETLFPAGLPNGNNDYVGIPSSLLDPRLGSLNNNGGPTPTHALLDDSPAIDAGSSTLSVDERGQPRVVDGDGDGFATSDIGAFELQRYPVTTLVDNGAGSLRQAILDNNAAGAGFIDIELPGTMNLLAELPFLDKDVTIKGLSADRSEIRRNSATPFRILTQLFGVRLSLMGLTISNGCPANQGSGGGILNQGELIVDSCIVRDNQALSAKGGGIYSSGVLLVKNSTILDNDADAGGGIFTEAIADNSLILNSTVSGNSASSGGGITSMCGPTEVLNCSVTNNDATVSGGGIRHWLNTLTLGNTIVAGNTAGQDSPDFLAVSPSVTVSSGGNLIGDHFGVEPEFPVGFPNGNSDYVGTSAMPVDPGLKPLGDYGGPTPIHALAADSVAIDHGLVGRMSQTDQRGLSGATDGNGDGSSQVDIGAFEVQRYTVMTLADSGAGSLREAMLDNNEAGAGFIEIEVPGTITLQSALPDIERDVSIAGLGADQTDIHRDEGAVGFRIFSLPIGVQAEISGLTVSNGESSSGGGAGILSRGDLTIESCVIRDNDAIDTIQQGGGVSAQGGNITLMGSAILSNSAFFGSGVSLVATTPGRMINCTVSGNRPALGSNGGAVTVGSPSQILNCTLTDNENMGLKVFSNLTMANTIVADNLTVDVQVSGGTIVTQGGNLIGRNDGVSTPFPPGQPNANFDFVGTSAVEVDPGLGPLEFYGGSTPCYALLVESVGVDAGRIPQGGSLPPLPATDQRGRPRMQNGNCDPIVRIDIGAYELNDCRAGNVNGASGVAQDVLLVNGSAGAFDGRILLPTGQSIGIELQASLSGPANNARYFIYVWLGDSVSPASFNVGGTYFGVLVNPGPIQGGLPQPFRCLRGTGISQAICQTVQELTVPDRAPFVLTDGDGVNNPNFKFTLQGMIEDNGSEAPIPFSVTNAVILQFF